MPRPSFANSPIQLHRSAVWRRTGAICAAIAIALGMAGTATLPAVGQEGGSRLTMVMPAMDSERGRKLFVHKGCVVCHSVNGVGGKAAPALDAPQSGATVDVLEFAARMWRGAEIMLVLQEMELGYQIELSGADLADLAAFAYDAEEQRRFSPDDIPDLIKDWSVDEIYDELDTMAP